MSSRRISILLLVGGVLLLANPLWLFPHEGDTRYTYERSEIVVENGTLTYRGGDVRGLEDENGLNPVGCQYYDDEQPRACAFDRHLVNRPRVSVPMNGLEPIRPEFVHINGAYFRRIHQLNETSDRTVTHDVERVSPRTVLAESAINITNWSQPVSDHLGLAGQIAVTGNSVTTFEYLRGDELGNVYRDNGTYYTVVATDEHHVDSGPDALRYELPRYYLMGAGLLLLAFGLLEEFRAD